MYCEASDATLPRLNGSNASAVPTDVAACTAFNGLLPPLVKGLLICSSCRDRSSP